MKSRDVHDEYESAAEWCALRGIHGKIGDPLPRLLSAECHELIGCAPEDFKQRVSDYAYALAMEADVPQYD